ARASDARGSDRPYRAGSPRYPLSSRSPPHRMRTPSTLAIPLALAVGSLALTAPALAAQAPPTAGYRDHARLARSLDSLQRAHPRLVTVSTIGTSAGGRAVHAVRLASGGDADTRPALLVVANAYGPHVLGSE